MPIPRPCPECGNDIGSCLCFDHDDNDNDFEPGRHINEIVYTEKAKRATGNDDVLPDSPLPTFYFF